jgi:hypothetical protein
MDKTCSVNLPEFIVGEFVTHNPTLIGYWVLSYLSRDIVSLFGGLLLRTGWHDWSPLSLNVFPQTGWVTKGYAKAICEWGTSPDLSLKD